MLLHREMHLLMLVMQPERWTWSEKHATEALNARQSSGVTSGDSQEKEGYLADVKSDLGLQSLVYMQMSEWIPSFCSFDRLWPEVFARGHRQLLSHSQQKKETQWRQKVLSSLVSY